MPMSFENLVEYYLDYMVFERMTLPVCVICGAVLSEKYKRQHFNSLHMEIYDNG